MDTTILREIEQLRRASIAQLRERHRELFGEEPRTHHREALFRRVAWRLQAKAEGGLSERARQRASEIATDHDIRVLPPRGAPVDAALSASSRFDRRIPPTGTVLRREYGGQTVAVTVLSNGFEHRGRTYGSLSAIATEITGTRWNGFAFFGLTGTRDKRKGLYAAAQR